jgi:hypothetical protein
LIPFIIVKGDISFFFTWPNGVKVFLALIMLSAGISLIVTFHSWLNDALFRKLTGEYNQLMLFIGFCFYPLFLKSHVESFIDYNATGVTIIAFAVFYILLFFNARKKVSFSKILKVIALSSLMTFLLVPFYTMFLGAVAIQSIKIPVALIPT